MPSALININSGTGLRIFGTLTNIWLLLYLVSGRNILKLRVLIGLEASSETERISAE